MIRNSLTLDRIKELLSANQNISAWKITVNNTEAQELFFIKQTLDMNRSKDVEHLTLTLYKDFTIGEAKYRGSSSTEIPPTLSDEELIQLIEDTAFAASLVKNEYYPLVEACEEQPPTRKSNFDESPLSDWMPLLAEAVFKADIYEKGWINSAEFFLNKTSKRIINSLGVDVSFSQYHAQIEFIVNWKETSEEIELYKNLDFSDFNPEAITKSVDNLLKLARDKALAKNTPALKKATVLLTGEPVKDFLSYYYTQASASAVYNKVSTFKTGDNVQGTDIEGDCLNIVLDPQLENSTASAPYDSHGCPLKKITLYTDGTIDRLCGNKRFCYYLNSEPTGDIENMIVSGGSKSVEEMKKAPHLELITFSDFQMDTLTGDFAGEIRLGWYFDGTTTVPVTGGSISGNIKDVQKKMYLSKETEQNNSFVGPQTIQLFDVSVAGIEDIAS